MTAHVIRTEIRDPAVDAIALNDQQQQLIANRTPQVDSIAEVFAALAKTCDPAQRRLLRKGLTLLVDLGRANHAEGQLEHQVADVADQLARDLRAPLPHKQWTIKSVAAALRDPLAVIVNPVIQGEPKVIALENVDGLIDTCPRQLLQGVALRHELRVTKFTALQARIAARDRSRA